MWRHIESGISNVVQISFQAQLLRQDRTCRTCMHQLMSNRIVMRCLPNSVGRLKTGSYWRCELKWSSKDFSTLRSNEHNYTRLFTTSILP
ncbi:uncharacterized protein LAJ45_03511 [Morchella importuna]|uniref:uncharacterized protein n=1 Tax=Morchella importuna TaxID=1174673 RepID=UPI001E8D68EB|nr:uncharacterized protein LAJ45_03511 [Morchella importuna]KAH8152670.1 hypothetical protein LAJ45_03511 [Morchella importuna]